MPAPAGSRFDVATELTFNRHATTEKMIAALADHEIGGAIIRVEEGLMDRSKMAVYIVDDRKPPDRE